MSISDIDTSLISEIWLFSEIVENIVQKLIVFKRMLLSSFLYKAQIAFQGARYHF